MRLLLGLTVLLLPCLLAAQPVEAPLQADTLLRAEVWKALRYEKAEALTPYVPMPLEASVRALETSADEGALSSTVLGIPVVLWLLLPFVWLVVWGLLVFLKHLTCLVLRVAHRSSKAERLEHVPRWAVAGLAFVLTLLVVVPLGAKDVAPPNPPGTLYPDDPLWSDPDALAVPVPAPLGISHFFDFLRSNFGDADTPEGPAVNTNTLGEVPNSSWYTNRHYQQRMPLDALHRGPLPGTGPVAGTWTVVKAKDDGKTPGFQIKDAEGARFLLKFDPYDFPELVTGAEVVSTKLLHALGYHVPENVIVRFRRDQLRAGPDTDLSPSALDAMLARVHRYPDGTYRAVASRFLHGTPIGPFALRDTRPDDANDVFPHENRRELRGLRVISAWLNHIDFRSPNSLDMLVKDGEAEYVRHHLIDFGSTLGAGPLGPVASWSGQEYALAFWPNLKRGLTFGLADPLPEVPLPPYPAIGRIDGATFEPDSWRPQQPNDAFRRMKPADAFWAAKQIAHFTDEEIAAAVASAAYTDPDAAAFLTDVLIQRRDKIAATYLDFGGGLDRFRVENDTLRFDDLRVRYGLIDQPPMREVHWYVGEGVDGQDARVRIDSTAHTALSLPSIEAETLTAVISEKPRHQAIVYLRRHDSRWQVVARRPR